MIKDIRKAIKHSLIYGLGNVLSKVAGLILLPLYTSYLTTEEYGALALLEVTSQLLIVFFSFKISTAMLRWCSTEKDPDKEKSIIYTTFVSVLTIGIFLFVIGYLFSEKLALLLFDSLDYELYFVAVSLWATFGIIIEVPLSIMRLREKAFQYMLINLSRFLTVLLLNIYFVAFAEYGVLGIVFGNLTGNAVFAIIAYPLIHKNINYYYNFFNFIYTI